MRGYLVKISGPALIVFILFGLRIWKPDISDYVNLFASAATILSLFMALLAGSKLEQYKQKKCHAVSVRSALQTLADEIRSLKKQQNTPEDLRSGIVDSLISCIEDLFLHQKALQKEFGKKFGALKEKRQITAGNIKEIIRLCEDIQRAMEIINE